MNVASYLWENFFPCFVHESRIHKNVDRNVYVEGKAPKHKTHIEQHEKYTKDTLSKIYKNSTRNPSHFSSQFYVKISFTYFPFLLRSRRETSTLTNNRAWEKIPCINVFVDVVVVRKYQMEML
jgi:hypothetical protein